MRRADIRVRSGRTFVSGRWAGADHRLSLAVGHATRESPDKNVRRQRTRMSALHEGQAFVTAPAARPQLRAPRAGAQQRLSQKLPVCGERTFLSAAAGHSCPAAGRALITDCRLPSATLLGSRRTRMSVGSGQECPLSTSAQQRVRGRSGVTIQSSARSPPQEGFFKYLSISRAELASGSFGASCRKCSMFFLASAMAPCPALMTPR
jgi:hypothetical protein